MRQSFVRVREGARSVVAGGGSKAGRSWSSSKVALCVVRPLAPRAVWRFFGPDFARRRPRRWAGGGAVDARHRDARDADVRVRGG